MARPEAAGSDLGWEPPPKQGWVAPHIAAEFPGLGIAWVELEGGQTRSPEPVRRRLRDLSDRFYGSHAIHMRERPIPWAYRVFFRQIGLDPDQHPHPGRAARPRSSARRRLRQPRHARPTPSRSPRSRPASPCASSTLTQAQGRALHPRLGTGRVAARKAGQAGPGNADDRRRADAAGAALRRLGGRSRARSGGKSDRDRRGAGQGRAPGGDRRGALDRRRRDRGLIGRFAFLNRFIVFSGGTVIYTRFGSYAGSARSRHAHDASSGRRRAPRARRAAPSDRPPRARAFPSLRGGLPAPSRSTPRSRPASPSRGSPGSRSWSRFATRSPERIASARRALRKQDELETRNRELLEQMLTAPAEHKWMRISRADVGEPGCGHWHSRPRLGPLGMLMGWWRVKVSSGCPLSGRLAAVER